MYSQRFRSISSTWHQQRNIFLPPCQTRKRNLILLSLNPKVYNVWLSTLKVWETIGDYFSKTWTLTSPSNRRILKQSLRLLYLNFWKGKIYRRSSYTILIVVSQLSKLKTHWNALSKKCTAIQDNKEANRSILSSVMKNLKRKKIMRIKRKNWKSNPTKWRILSILDLKSSQSKKEEET